MLANNGEKVGVMAKKTRRKASVKKPRAPKVIAPKPAPTVKNAGIAQPITPEPNTYYWALFYGEKEIVLTAPHNAGYFYLHGDEYMRKVDSPGVQLVKKIWTRCK